MSDSYGSLDRARYYRIAAEYGTRIANLSFDVFDVGSPFGLMVLPRMASRARRANDDVLLNRPIGGISLPSLPSESETPTQKEEDWQAEEARRQQEEWEEEDRRREQKEWDRQQEEWEEYHRREQEAWNKQQREWDRQQEEWKEYHRREQEAWNKQQREWEEWNREHQFLGKKGKILLKSF